MNMNNDRELVITNIEAPIVFARINETDTHKNVRQVYENRKKINKNNKDVKPVKMSNGKEDLTGNKYGSLLVTGMAYKYPMGDHKRTACYCKCDCGNEIVVAATKLTHGRIRSCGCMSKELRAQKKRDDITGKKYGRLTVLKTYWIDGRAKCDCLCECGNTKTVSASNLKLGTTKSCGCIRKETNSARSTKDWTGVVSDYGAKFIRPTGEIRRGHKKWECECGYCGNIFTAIPGAVMSGKVKSCGCLKKTNVKRRAPDITGQRFEKLVVEKMVYGKTVRGRKRTYCECVCDCGNIINLTPHELTSGKRVSCGCDAGERIGAKLRKDVTGNKYGRLTVKRVFWENRRSRCICVCDCGTEIETSTSSVINGQTKSCGCYKKEMTTLTNSKDWTGVVSPTGVKFIEKAFVGDQGLWVWKCICGVCGEEMYAIPWSIMSGHKKSCGCVGKSYGEEHISKLLNKLSVNYSAQYKFDDCIYKRQLKFDFAVFNEDNELSFLIEYDGEQHTRPVDYFGGKEEFIISQKRDNIKNKYCEENGIDLLRIPYYLPFEEVDNVIIDKLNKH